MDRAEIVENEYGFMVIAPGLDDETRGNLRDMFIACCCPGLFGRLARFELLLDRVNITYRHGKREHALNSENLTA